MLLWVGGVRAVCFLGVLDAVRVIGGVAVVFILAFLKDLPVVVTGVEGGVVLACGLGWGVGGVVFGAASGVRRR